MTADDISVGNSFLSLVISRRFRQQPKFFEKKNARVQADFWKLDAYATEIAPILFKRKISTPMRKPENNRYASIHREKMFDSSVRLPRPDSLDDASGYLRDFTDLPPDHG